MTFIKSKIILPAIFTTFLVGCESEHQVSYQKEIKPIIDKNCNECHLQNTEGAKASGFLTENYDTLMKGTHYGPVIKPGHPIASTFYRLAAGLGDPSITNPHSKESIPEDQIAKIKTWIAQGAKNN